MSGECSSAGIFSNADLEIRVRLSVPERFSTAYEYLPVTATSLSGIEKNGEWLLFNW